MTEPRVWVPREDQGRVLAWLAARERGAVFAPTGTGKTVMAATWLHDRLFDRFSAGRALIVAPRLVVEGWLAQFMLWQHLAGLREAASVVAFSDMGLIRSKRSDGRPGPLAFLDKRSTKKALMQRADRVHLCSWDTFSWLEEVYGASWPYDTLILDESTFIKDRGSARGRAARRAVHNSGKVDRLLLLTATPNSNGDEALFAQMDLVDRGCLGSGLQNFRDTYCLPASKNWSTGQVYSWALAPAMRPAFEETVARLSVSVPDSLGLELLEVEHRTPMPADAVALYRELKKEQVLDDVTAANAAVVHAKLRQLATGWVYRDDGTVRLVHTAKMDRLAELLEEIPGQVIVAFNWQFEADALRDLLKDRFADIRDRGAKQQFIDGKLRVLGVHPQSAGFGVDGLQARSNNIIWLSVPEDRELYDQTNGRLKRAGQDQKTVFVHALVAPGTEEERVWREVLPTKLANADRVLQAARLPSTVAA